jgi:FecR protein
MNDDYIVDGTGTPDPEVVRLERLLGRLRSTATQPPVPVRLKPDTTESPIAHAGSVRLQADRSLYLGVRFVGALLAAAAAIVLMVGLTWKALRPAPAAAGEPSRSSWEVAVIVGSPRVGGSVLTGEGRIAVGQTLTTDAGSRATIEVSDIGHVTVDEQTRIRLIDSRDGHHRLALDRGTLHAAIAAPPGQFVVSTPSATATDLGCVYSLHVNDDGSGLLSVEAGWVAFEERGRESFVPAGASSRTDRVNGPGTPRYDDAEPAFRDAIDEVDNGHDARRKEASLHYVLDRARARDAMTLWHLIPRVGDADRGAVVDALNTRVPMPPAASRDAVLRLDRTSLDQWWDTLGLDQASWWRKWKVAQ